MARERRRSGEEGAEDAEILTLRHQITLLERQLNGARPRFSPTDRAFLAS
jgi:putative transposase